MAWWLETVGEFPPEPPFALVGADVEPNPLQLSKIVNRGQERAIQAVPLLDVGGHLYAMNGASTTLRPLVLSVWAYTLSRATSRLR